MDIDSAATTMAKPPPKKPKIITPSASSESASPHPDMSLAMSIHRLHMVSDGKLSVDDATSIIGMSPIALLEKVMKRVGTGGKSLDEAMTANHAKYIKVEKGEGGGAPVVVTVVEEKGVEDSDMEEGEALLNPHLYRHLQSTLSYNGGLSDADLDTLQAHHTTVLTHLQSLVTKAIDEAGDMEVLSANVDIARYLAKVSTKDAAMEAYTTVLALPKLSAGKTLDAHLEMARVCSFWGDFRKMTETLGMASKAIAKGGDWDRRNRLKIYRALSYLTVRDVSSASELLVEGMATFSCPELCSYEEYIGYAILAGLLSLKRTELKKNIIDGSEVLQVAKDIPVLTRLSNTLYDCDYKAYLHGLVDLQPHLVANRYLQHHAGYLLRELHVLAYQQFLDSYQSVTLVSMATSFGVGTDFLDVQLSRFIAAGRLTAKIDKYGGVVETNRPDWKNARYQEMIQKGDLLLNRIQKLGRVVDL